MDFHTQKENPLSPSDKRGFITFNKYIMSIYEKIFKVKSEGITLTKDTKAHHYSYATLSQIQEKLSGALEENKLVVIHSIVDNFVRTEIVDVDKPEDKIMSEIKMSEGTKAQDKGSEITYYRRYNLLSLLDLEVEDDDGAKAQGVSKKTQAQKTYEKKDVKWFNDKEVSEWTVYLKSVDFATAEKEIKSRGYSLGACKAKVQELCKK